MVVSLFTPTTEITAANTPTLTVETIEAEPGDEVKVAVTLSDNPGICAFRIAVNYDAGLTLTKVIDERLYGDAMFGNNLNANPYILMWDDSLKASSNKSNGALAYLTFKVDDNVAPGTYKVWITYNTGDIYDLKLNDIDVDLVAGGVNIAEKTVTTQEVTNTPEPTAISKPTATPKPTEITEPTVSPEPTVTPTPVVTATPVATSTPIATTTPVTPTPEVTSTPVTTTIPELTSAPEPTDIDDVGTRPTGTGTDITQPAVTGNDVLQPTGADNETTPTETEKPETTKAPTVTKAFTTTVTDANSQTVKYKVTPDTKATNGIAGSATVVSLKTENKSIVIPDTVVIDGKTYKVTAIGRNALKTNKKATKLQIGANVSTIEQNAFKGLKKLKSITIKSGKISKIGSGAFSGIYKKATISIKTSKKAYKEIVSLIKNSGVSEKVKFKRTK